jgi:hypothetical protein
MNLDIMKIIKNPIILGIIAAILVYLYLSYEEENKVENKVKNKLKKRKPISILTPGVIGIIVWFIGSSCGPGEIKVENKIEKSIDLPVNLQNSLVGGDKSSVMIKENIMKDNLNLKQMRPLTSELNLPPVDVFIDLARFT